MKFLNIRKFKFHFDFRTFKEQCGKIVNDPVTSLKSLWLRMKEDYVVFTNHITSGSANSLISIIVIAVGIFMISTTVSQHKVDIARAAVDIEQAKIAIADVESARLVEIAMIEADAKLNIMKYQARAEEARAASNPFVIAAEQSKQPVNVYIDTSNSNYVVETSDGATEIAISTIRVKGVKYTPEQRKLMTMAFHIGQEVGFPETIQSLLLQETRAGAYGDRIGDINLPIGKRSYGVMQMKVATARKVLRSYKTLVPSYFPNRKTYKRVRDEEIIIKLIQDDEFNIRLAALNFTMHRKQSKNWAQAVVGYNTGQGAANRIAQPKKHKYYTGILKRLISEVRPFNQETKLSF